MTQLIVAKNNQGIIMAADSKAYDFDLQGDMQEVTVNPLIKLGQYTMILAGGDAEAVQIAQSLAGFIHAEGLSETGEILTAALPFINSEYEKVMRKKCNFLPVDPVQHMYFILGGMSEDQDSTSQVNLSITLDFYCLNMQDWVGAARWAA